MACGSTPLWCPFLNYLTCAEDTDGPVCERIIQDARVTVNVWPGLLMQYVVVEAKEKKEDE